MTGAATRNDPPSGTPTCRKKFALPGLWRPAATRAIPWEGQAGDEPGGTKGASQRRTWLAYTPFPLTAIHLVRTGGGNPEPHQPVLNPDVGLDHMNSLLARRGTKDHRG